MSWQKCPICNGTGIDPGPNNTMSTCPVCTVCNGKRIISEVNGLPPGSMLPSYPEINMPVYPMVNSLSFKRESIDDLIGSPVPIKPTNLLKRTEQEKDKIRQERILDPALRIIDAEKRSRSF